MATALVFHADWSAVQEDGRSAYHCEAYWPGEFRSVAVVSGAETPDDAYSLTNHVDSAWWDNKGVTRVGPETRSTSPGDVVVVLTDDDNNARGFRCEGFGWTEFDPWNGQPPYGRADLDEAV